MDLIQVHRRIYTDKSTIGDLYFDGAFECSTLEDPVRQTKLHGETAIPAGRYRLTIEPSPRYKRLMPRLNDVPGYSGVLIHWGNFPSDTQGCLLVGRYDPHSAPDFISSSRKAFDQLFAKLDARKNEEMWISIHGGHPQSSSRRS
jgi:hypothetical protein